MEALSSFFTAGAAAEGVIDGDWCVNKEQPYDAEEGRLGESKRHVFAGEEEVVAIGLRQLN